ncbi:hypothetical protein WMY93_032304 [Mugilogobius chulae]|uniref:RRM domain-containing protein n=1 Tax=Mugilogobius chulae TaxID=88201 RepID=A0AAW0MRE1_9GOBI
MAVVIRLQGLPIVAGTMDIRHFFSGLTIPDGGVHIVGGEHGEAFIVFATDEDARLGMMRGGGAIKGAKVSLLLSSKTEMQNTIELSRRRFEPAPSEAPPTGTRAPAVARPLPPPPAPAVHPPAALTQEPKARPTWPRPSLQLQLRPSFSAAPSFSSAPTLTTALASLNPPLMAALPPMPSLAPPSLAPPTVPPLSLSHIPLTTPLATPLPPLGLHMKPALPLSPPHEPGRPGAVGAEPAYSCSEAELRDFFRGGALEGVRFVRDGQGRSTGRAFVRFFSPQDSYEALKRGGGAIGSGTWRLAPPPSCHDRGRVRARSRSPHRHSDLCVYLKGLPYEVDKSHVKEFFKNLSLIEDTMFIAYGSNGKATGEGFVEFSSEQDYKAALGAHMQYMGARFIQVHPISRKGMADKIEQIRKRESEGKGAEHNRTPKTCVHITNIPYNVSRKDVRAFLEGLNMYEETLQVLTDAHGNGLGQAVVQLRSDEDARKAERLHRQKLNGRDAFVHLVTYEHMKEVERNPPPQNKRGQRPPLGQAPPTSHMTPPTSHMTPPPSHLGPPPSHAFGALAEDFSFIRSPAPFAPPFSAPGNGLAPPPMPPLGLAPDLAPPPLVSGILEAGFRATAPFGDGLRGPGAPPPSFPPDPALRSAPPPAANANANGGPAVVKLQNMPFTVTADEIMDFFYGYQVVPGSVCLQFNDKGLPTGEAMVAFQSADEANAAVSDLNERPIGSRKVKISLG